MAQIAEDVCDVSCVYSTLDPATGSSHSRRRDFDELASVFRAKATPLHLHMAGLMERWAPGLFAGDNVDRNDDLPRDNLDLERWFRRPKGHERHIHGHAHAGVRLVHQGPTLMLTLDAHLRHPDPFTADHLVPYRKALPPVSCQEAEQRRAILRKARSPKKRKVLLAELERRYRAI